MLDLVTEPPHLRVLDDEAAADPRAAAAVTDRIVEILAAALSPSVATCVSARQAAGAARVSRAGSTVDALLSM